MGLAKKLANYILASRSTENFDTKKDETRNLSKSYQFVWVKEVIAADRKKLWHKFVKDSESLSSEAKNFWWLFKDAFHNRRKTHNLDINSVIKVEDLEKFVQKEATLMQKVKGSEEIQLEKNKVVIRNQYGHQYGHQRN